MLHPRPRLSTLCAVLSCALLFAPGCKSNDQNEVRTPARERAAKEPAAAVESRPVAGDTGAEEDAAFDQQRQALVEHLRRQGIGSERVLQAIAQVPRHQLVPADMKAYSYLDRPLPIGEGQTISQPYIVALMTQLADIDEGEKVLEVGTGSGYQAAVLAELSDRVYSIEIVEPLAKRARADLERMGYGDEIEFRIGDGYAGWPEAAPFGAIVVTAAPPKIPEPLKDQLAEGGRMVIPVGEDGAQELRLLVKEGDELVERSVIPVRFVPMTGKARGGQ